MLLTMKEKNKIEVVQGVMDERIEVNDAGRVLNRSVRQVYRMLKKLREKGLEGLIHGNKGKKSPRKIKKAIRRRIVELARIAPLPEIDILRLNEIHDKALRDNVLDRLCDVEVVMKRFRDEYERREPVSKGT